jgi:hypothetical protein
MPVTIQVERTGDCEFSVRIDDGELTTSQRITMRIEEYERITGRRADPMRLVKQTIEMLLSRPRPKTIPPECDLTIFAIYFAEFECARAATNSQTD